MEFAHKMRLFKRRGWWYIRWRGSIIAYGNWEHAFGRVCEIVSDPDNIPLFQ